MTNSTARKGGFIFTVFITAFMFFTANVSAEIDFKDVSRGKSHYEGISYLASKGIEGYEDGTFGISKPLTRPHSAIMFTRVLDLAIPAKSEVTNYFDDVSRNHDYAHFIAAVGKEGIFKGSNGNFLPNNVMTREQMATTLVSAFKLKDNGKAVKINLSNVSASHKKNVQILANLGITSQLKDFRPNEAVTRGQFATFLYQTMVAIGELDEMEDLEVHFIDVGQGDSTLIVTDSGKTILIDGGRKSAGDEVTAYLKEQGIQKIDLMVATHPDADHIGGLIDVLEQFKVAKVLDGGKEHTTDTYFEYLTLIDEKNIPFEVAKIGDKRKFDNQIDIQVLNGENSSSDLNESSVVLKVTQGEIDFLLTGDASVANEAEMMQQFNVESEILKVGHHGSSTSTSTAFLREVEPEVGILSYGENNYGHPNSTVVNRLRNIGAEIFSTYQSGDILITANDINYNVSASPWKGDGVGSNPAPKPNPKPEPKPDPAPHLINVNKADKETLMLIPGVGDAIAGHIIEYRNANGPFTSINQLDHVKQIGSATLNKMRPHITL